MECIVLAGGLGTRLRSVIGAQPKCMASINGRPFLEYLIRYLDKSGVTRIILSLGYGAEVVTDWLQFHPGKDKIVVVKEEEPLGTGGAVSFAMQQAEQDHVFILNGDTLFEIDLGSLCAFHKEKASETSIALKEMTEFDRYGSVLTDGQARITAFEEKKYRGRGRINGGIYLVNRKRFLERGLAGKFSFEKDYLERYTEEGKFFGQAFPDYFIDIGVPEDYERAKHDFKIMFE